MFAYLNWVSDLEGISPIARLMGLRMANYATYVGDGTDLLPDEPACAIDLANALAWIGCEQEDLLRAMEELLEEGVRPLRIEGGKIVYTFPQLEERNVGARQKSKHARLSIYVITALPNVNKIGIARKPEYRLDNLQAANPTQRLNIAWQFEGPSTVIRRVERDAHAELSAVARGREWFDISTDGAIAVVKSLLVRAGLLA